VEEGLVCLNHEGVDALQVIFNIFRQKPLETLLPEAKRKGTGILVRLPLASGLLTGKFTQGHRFEEDDHRAFNEMESLLILERHLLALVFQREWS